MHSAHNGTDYGSIPCGLNYKNYILYRVLGRVWFMALVLKTSTFKSREFKSHSARTKKK